MFIITQLNATQIRELLNYKMQRIMWILAEYPQLIAGGLIILSAVFLISRMVKRQKMKRAGAKTKGFKNFKGDIWYPDGRVWVNDKKKLEEPDYTYSKKRDR